MFDRMSKTYGLANLITSFGFTAKWRSQCLHDLPAVKPNALGYDLMSGMGESWGDIQNTLGNTCQIIALDISEEMNRKASHHLQRLKTKNIELKKANILHNDIPSNSADFVVSTFGIKTFDEKQQRLLASEVDRILKPGGAFAFIEISKPKGFFLKGLYMFYLKIVIPIIGKVFMGNSDDYRMLGKYCSHFNNCHHFHSCLGDLGLNSKYKDYFFGCASGVHGTK
ncbi:class I SAM-dependent methyltransferase [Marinilongibacter aquaticus]|nr:class I SAM-dependent methyltransferase [Marinilongibacter aquaticus]